MVGSIWSGLVLLLRCILTPPQAAFGACRAWEAAAWWLRNSTGLGESTGIGRCCRKGIQVVPEPSRRESTGVDGSRVVRTERSSNWQLPIGVQITCEAPLVATRFPSIPVDSAPLGARRGLPFAGHGVTGPRIGGCHRWDYASERSAAKSRVRAGLGTVPSAFDTNRDINPWPRRGWHRISRQRKERLYPNERRSR